MLIAGREEELQGLVHTINEKNGIMGLSLNIKKTETMVISKRKICNLCYKDKQQIIETSACLWHVCTCSKHFRKHLLFDQMLSNLTTMFTSNSTQSGKTCARIMQKSVKSIVTSTSLVAKWILD